MDMRLKVFVAAVSVLAISLSSYGIFPADLNGNCQVEFSDFAKIAAGWMVCNDPRDIACPVVAYPILSQNFDGFATGSIGLTSSGTQNAAGVGSQYDTGGEWRDLGVCLAYPIISSPVSHSGSQSLLIARDIGRGAVGWTAAAGVKSGTPFSFISYIYPLSYGSVQGSWTMNPNNYNNVQLYCPVMWYTGPAGNLFVYGKSSGTETWLNTGCTITAGTWTGIKLNVTQWNDGTGTGSYDAYIDQGSGFSLAKSGITFNSSELFDDVNAVGISPQGPAGNLCGYIDDVQITIGLPDCNAVWSKGLGMAADINHDCHIDMKDMEILAASWLNWSPCLHIPWRRGPEYPMGIQDSAVGVINGKVVSAGGFSRRPLNVVSEWPDAFEGQSSGFTKLTLLFDPANESAGWTRIADVPLTNTGAYQAAASAVVNNAMYIMGGFNYTDPFCYNVCYRLSQSNGTLSWTQMPSLPWVTCEASAVVIGQKIYLICGSDYYQCAGATQSDFHTEVGRPSTAYPNGSPVAQGLLVLDTTNISAGWQRLADMPGTHRTNAGVAAVNNKIYVLGGNYGPNGTTDYDYCNVDDSWVYDVASNTWSALPDMPDGANRKAVAYGNRYVVLCGGFKYMYTYRPDGSKVLAYSPAEVKTWNTVGMDPFFEKAVLVFDTATNQLGYADDMLDTSSWPLTAVNGNTIYTLGGEGGTAGGQYIQHPSLFEIGVVSTNP
jgi:N-acetylneuraminic acid mutarotase